MSQGALVRLGESTAEAVSGILEMFAAGRVSGGEVSVVGPDRPQRAIVVALPHVPHRTRRATPKPAAS